MSNRAHALAERIEQGARELGELAGGLSDVEWRTKVLPDGRTVGVIVHHVASVYPIEFELARTLAAGKPILGVTWDVIAEMNRKHAQDHGGATKQEALELLAKNSGVAAEAVRQLSDEELDPAAKVSLNGDASLTAQ